MNERKRSKPRSKSSVNEAPSQPDGVRRPSEGGVGSEYGSEPPIGERSPTSKTPP